MSQADPGYNPHRKPWVQPHPNQVAGKGAKVAPLPSFDEGRELLCLLADRAEPGLGGVAPADAPEPELAARIDRAAAESAMWKELDDVFWTVIPFGTGGRRGKMFPVGSNSINDRTIGESAKGLADWRVTFRHALRNALIPLITLLGLSLPAIVSGALIVENVFNYPGMGLLTVQSAFNVDIPVVLGTTLVITVATVLGSLLADIFYAVADPRIRLGRS